MDKYFKTTTGFVRHAVDTSGWSVTDRTLYRMYREWAEPDPANMIDAEDAQIEVAWNRAARCRMDDLERKYADARFDQSRLRWRRCFVRTNRGVLC